MFEFFNKIATFLFINAKTKARLIWLKEREYLQNREAVSLAREIYEKQIRRYLFGLGFFLSFIPGTEAYAARKDLYDILLKSSEGIEFTGLIEFLIPTVIGFVENCTDRRNDMSFKEKIEETILRSGSKPWISPLNPFQYISLLIYNLEIFDSFFVIDNSIPKKIVLIVVVLPLFLLTSVLTILTELLLTTIDTLIFDPIRFVCEEIKQNYDFWDKEFTYLPHNEAELIEKITDALDESEDEKKFRICTDKKSLRILSKEAKKQETVHLNSPFFKKFKNEPELPFQSRETIAKAYNAYTNSQHFFVFNAAKQVLPKEVGKLIIKTCLDEKFIVKNQQVSKNTVSI